MALVICDQVTKGLRSSERTATIINAHGRKETQTSSGIHSTMSKRECGEVPFLAASF